MCHRSVHSLILTVLQARLFADQTYTHTNDLYAWARANFASAPQSVIRNIVEQVYPAVYDGSFPWRTPLERANLAQTEYTISCNAVDMARAYPRRAFNYLWSQPPAIHSQDLLYTYWNGQSDVVNVRMAETLQKGITQFVMTGNPNSREQQWPVYSRSQKVLNFGAGTISSSAEPADNSRCDWWLKGLYQSTVGLGTNATYNDPGLQLLGNGSVAMTFNASGTIVTS